MGAEEPGIGGERVREDEVRVSPVDLTERGVGVEARCTESPGEGARRPLRRPDVAVGGRRPARQEVGVRDAHPGDQQGGGEGGRGEEGPGKARGSAVESAHGKIGSSRQPHFRALKRVITARIESP